MFQRPKVEFKIVSANWLMGLRMQGKNEEVAVQIMRSFGAHVVGAQEEPGDGSVEKLMGEAGYTKVGASNLADGTASEAEVMCYFDKSVVGPDKSWASVRCVPLTNAIYLQRGCGWFVSGGPIVQTIQSNITLSNGYPLAPRSVVLVPFHVTGYEKEVWVACTHLSGGRWEDLDAPLLKEERKKAINTIINLLKGHARTHDFQIILGDFNSSQSPTKQILEYFESVVKVKEQFQTSFKQYKEAKGIDDAEELFVDYMCGVFGAMQDAGFVTPYREALIAPTSAFGHIVDHICTNGLPGMTCNYADVVRMCNPIKGEKVLENEVSDHNALRVSLTFDMGSYGPSPKRRCAVETGVQGGFTVGYIGSPGNLKDTASKAQIIALLAGLAKSGGFIYIGPPNADAFGGEEILKKEIGSNISIEDMANAGPVHILVVTPGGSGAEREARSLKANVLCKITKSECPLGQGSPGWYNEISGTIEDHSYDFKDNKIEVLIEVLIEKITESD
jgi:endonuclease/exonuclease/phosphatase family metal-dependent hydrolase